MIGKRVAVCTVLCVLKHRVHALAPGVGVSQRTHLPWTPEGLGNQRRGYPLQSSAESLTPTAENDVFALDFDGVICDSQFESSRSALRAVREIWPEVVKGTDVEDDDAPAWLLQKMRKLRPIVETGYENVLLTRLLIEEKRVGETSTVGTRPLTVGEITANWGPDMRDTLMIKYGAVKEELVELFGRTRDTWMEEDQEDWLGANYFYEGVNEAVEACAGEVYVVTTKQKRFASALLKHAGLSIPEDHIFGLGSGPKADVLCHLRDTHRGATLHFFEDRVETLETICDDPRLVLNSVRLYLCKWGFNTLPQRERGAANPRIELIDSARLMEVLAPGKSVESSKSSAGKG